MRARDEEPLKTLYSLTGRPKEWKADPISSVYMSEEKAAAKREAAKEKHEKAKENLAAARIKAEEAEAAATIAGFNNATLNAQASEAVLEWRAAKGG